MIAGGQARRFLTWLSAAPALAGLAVWWPMLDPSAPDWPRIIPPPLSLAAALAWVWSSRSKARAASVLTAVLLAAAFANDAELRRSIRPPENPAFRIVQWSLDENSDAAALLAELERELPHVVVLHHPPATLASLRQFNLARRLRLHHATRHDSILIISRYSLEPLEPPHIDGIETLFVRVKDPAGNVYVLVVDAASRPLDIAATRALGNFIEAHTDARPLALAFGNARERTDAVWRPVRRAMRAAYEVAGFGWPYSRPARLPLYARDHIWISDEWIAHSVGYRWSRHASRLRHFAILSRAQSR